jgi:hypothetical protein
MVNPTPRQVKCRPAGAPILCLTPSRTDGEANLGEVSCMLKDERRLRPW